MQDMLMSVMGILHAKPKRASDKAASSEKGGRNPEKKIPYCNNYAVVCNRAG